MMAAIIRCLYTSLEMYLSFARYSRDSIVSIFFNGGSSILSRDRWIDCGWSYCRSHYTLDIRGIVNDHLWPRQLGGLGICLAHVFELAHIYIWIGSALQKHLMLLH